MLSGGLTTSSTCQDCYPKFRLKACLQLSRMSPPSHLPRLNWKNLPRFRLLRKQRIKRKRMQLRLPRINSSPRSRPRASPINQILPKSRKQPNPPKWVNQPNKKRSQNNSNKSSSRSQNLRRRLLKRKLQTSLRWTSELVKLPRFGNIPIVTNYGAKRSILAEVRFVRLPQGFKSTSRLKECKTRW